jgi:hypothetical protein
MYNISRGLTPAKFDCDRCVDWEGPFAEGTDQACLYNVQQLWAY